MKAGKIVLIIVAVIVLINAVGYWLLISNIDGIAKDGVEDAGRKLLNTRVEVESVELTILKGKAGFSGLVIDNPRGFSDRPALKFGFIEVDVDLISTADEVLVIDHILIQDPTVNFEVDENGRSNIDAFQGRVEEHAPSAGTDTGLLIIDRLDFKGGTINASAPDKTSRELEFDFPALSMSGLGRPDGASPEQIGAEIAEELMDRILNAAKQAGVDALVDEQKDRLREKADEKLKEQLGDLFDRD